MSSVGCRCACVRSVLLSRPPNTPFQSLASHPHTPLPSPPSTLPLSSPSRACTSPSKALPRENKQAASPRTPVMSFPSPLPLILSFSSFLLTPSLFPPRLLSLLIPSSPCSSRDSFVDPSLPRPLPRPFFLPLPPSFPSQVFPPSKRRALVTPRLPVTWRHTGANYAKFTWTDTLWEGGKGGGEEGGREGGGREGGEGKGEVAGLERPRGRYD